MDPTTYTYTYGRAGSKAARLREAAHAEVERVRDAVTGTARTIVRFIYYRLVAAEVVAKDGQQAGPRKASQDVSEALTWLREAGLVGWDEIVDESRMVIDQRGWPTIRDGLHDLASNLRLDPWDGNPPALVVESKSLAAFFRPTAYTYRIPLVALGGQSSGGFLSNDVAALLGPDTDVVYVGDWDKAGGDIEQSAHDRLRRFAPDWNGDWYRVAVTDDQADRYADLLITKTDKRDGRSYETLEAEAIEQTELLAAVTDALDLLLPVSLEDIDADEQDQQDDALRHLSEWDQ